MVAFLQALSGLGKAWPILSSPTISWPIFCLKTTWHLEKSRYYIYMWYQRQGIGSYGGKGTYLKKPFAPYFMIYIFEIVLQFPIDWLKRTVWNFFVVGQVFTQDPCGPPSSICRTDASTLLEFGSLTSLSHQSTWQDLHQYSRESWPIDKYIFNPV